MANNGRPQKKLWMRIAALALVAFILIGFLIMAFL